MLTDPLQGNQSLLGTEMPVAPFLGYWLKIWYLEDFLRIFRLMFWWIWRYFWGVLMLLLRFFDFSLVFDTIFTLYLIWFWTLFFFKFRQNFPQSSSNRGWCAGRKTWAKIGRGPGDSIYFRTISFLLLLCTVCLIIL